MSVDLYNRAMNKLGSENTSHSAQVPSISIPETITGRCNNTSSINSSEEDTKSEVENAPVRGERCELIDLTTTKRPGAEQPSVIPTSHFKRPKKDLRRYDDYALKVIRYVDQDGADTGVGKSLEISSPFLQKCLRPLLSKHAFLNFAADPIVINRPFAPIFHLRADISRLAKITTDVVAAQHLNLLLEQFCEPYLGQTIKTYEGEVPRGLVRYELLWTLFKAEDDIIVEHNNYREVHRVMHCEYGEEAFLVYTWRWGYNAGKFGPCSETVVIPRYSSIRKVTQLACYPVEFVGDKAEQDHVYAQMIQRGKRWKEMIRPTHCEYTGPMWRARMEMETLNQLELSYTKGRVMLDYVLHSEWCPRLSDLLIGVHGYRINGRDARAQVRDTAFASIRLGTGGAERYLSRAVGKHDPDSQVFDDIVKGKGKGIIISLEGPPGSGKTLTAESVAAFTRRPLYSVSTSELGTAAQKAEAGLLSIYRRAEKWKAVVLLDEADLFLTERTDTDLERNALVTVFLRTLEYFRGVMFLTSNRVERFDPAFESRIHLRIRSSKPESTVRSQIWKALLPADCSHVMAERFGREFDINGRQIKNLINYDRSKGK
ncbi:hypothetical protein FGRMN_5903 [Fusarium graminum]|nr:hypothetical protein FGRMN_5903 [Fusarium graminum]